MRDCMKQQILDACGRMKSAAELLGYLMARKRFLMRDYPEDRSDSPRLRIAISVAVLGLKTGYGRTQIKKALGRLAALGLVTSHASRGEVSEYTVHEEALAGQVQLLPMCEQGNRVRFDQATGSLSDPVPGHSATHHRVAQRPGPPYIPSIPSITITGADDATSETQAQSQAQDPDLPDHGDQALDPERDRIIEAYRALNVAREKTEFHLTRHSRQKLLAALECLEARQRRGLRVPSPAGFVLGFLARPAEYGYELDPRSGHWRPASLIRLATKAQARHPPKLTPAEELLRQAAIAWDSIDSSRQTQIKDRIAADHPDSSPRQRLKLCQAHALALLTEEPHAEDQEDPDSHQSQARRPREGEARALANRVQGAHGLYSRA